MCGGGGGGFGLGEGGGGGGRVCYAGGDGVAQLVDRRSPVLPVISESVCVKKTHVCMHGKENDVMNSGLSPGLGVGVCGWVGGRGLGGT